MWTLSGMFDASIMVGVWCMYKMWYGNRNQDKWLPIILNGSKVILSETFLIRHKRVLGDAGVFFYSTSKLCRN